MTRDLDTLTAQTLDALIVGGGTMGLAIAYDAAQRGLTVGLIDRDDFGSGASFHRLPTVDADVRFPPTASRDRTRERRTLARTAPHAVRPLACVVPIYRSIWHGSLVTRAAFAARGLLHAGRPGDLVPSLRLARPRVISRGRAVQQFPGLRRQGLTGAAVFHDYIAPEADRLTLAFALAAAEHGAVLANYVEALAPLVDGRRVVGVRAHDRAGNRALEIRARVTINATGAAIDALLTPLGVPTGIHMTGRLSLVTKRDAGDEALGGFGGDQRLLFLVPWRQRALFGMWHGDTDDVATFIRHLNQAFPALDLSMNDVTLVHRALGPARVDSERVIDHGAAGVDGLISALASSTLAARKLAERITDLALSKLARAPVPCRTATSPLPGGSLRDVGAAIADARREYDAGLPSDSIPHLVVAYGSRYRDVLELVAERPEWRTRLAHDSPVIGAELAHAARKEMVTTLADAVVRRTPLGALGHPGEDALARAAAIVGGELRWTADRVREEIASVRKFYGTLNPVKT
ncbi:MAG: FAD-dependent oxidoreductase [Acidobacteria bacterium]|nr:FAD-dependent oxidoreductase [Acidobacteriota bacterium]